MVTQGDIFENYFGNNTLKSVNLTINSLNANNVYDNHFTFEKYNNPMGAITHSSLYALKDNRYTKQIFHSNRQDTTNGGLNYLEKIIVSDFGNYAKTLMFIEEKVILYIKMILLVFDQHIQVFPLN